MHYTGPSVHLAFKSNSLSRIIDDVLRESCNCLYSTFIYKSEWFSYIAFWLWLKLGWISFVSEKKNELKLSFYSIRLHVYILKIIKSYIERSSIWVYSLWYSFLQEFSCICVWIIITCMAIFNNGSIENMHYLITSEKSSVFQSCCTSVESTRSKGHVT